MTKENLEKMLKEIRDDRDFIMGVSICLSNDEERQEVADAIRSGYLKDEGDIVEYAFGIYTETHPANADDEEGEGHGD